MEVCSRVGDFVRGQGKSCRSDYSTDKWSLKVFTRRDKFGIFSRVPIVLFYVRRGVLFLLPFQSFDRHGYELKIFMEIPLKYIGHIKFLWRSFIMETFSYY